VLGHNRYSAFIYSQKGESLFCSHISDTILFSVLVTDTVKGSVIVYGRIRVTGNLQTVNRKGWKNGVFVTHIELQLEYCRGLVRNIV
jgi:hypothetical protein